MSILLAAVLKRGFSDDMLMHASGINEAVSAHVAAAWRLYLTPRVLDRCNLKTDRLSVETAYARDRSLSMSLGFRA
jgi:hypothetical protein